MLGDHKVFHNKRLKAKSPITCFQRLLQGKAFFKSCKEAEVNMFLFLGFDDVESAWIYDSLCEGRSFSGRVGSKKV